MVEQTAISLKHRIRLYVDVLAAKTGLMSFWEQRMQQGLTILMYHRVLPDKQCFEYPLDSLVIPTDVFRVQMKWLSQHCKVMPVREARKELESGGIGEKPLVAVTFDDGYADNAEIAAPIMEEFGLRGTFFVSSGFVEEGRPLWYDRAADLWHRLLPDNRKLLIRRLDNDSGVEYKNSDQVPSIKAWMAGLKLTAPEIRMDLISSAEALADGAIDSELYRSMTREQVITLNKQGHEIGSHTVSHPILPLLDDDLLRIELAESSAKIGEWTGERAIGFCYPNGDFDDRVECAVADAGYSYACTMQTGLNQPGCCSLRLNRLSITTRRTVVAGYELNPLSFRSELCRFREFLR